MTIHEIIAEHGYTGNEEDMTEAFFEAAFAHYMDSGEMPYGAMTGEEIDPYLWIAERIEQELE